MSRRIEQVAEQIQHILSDVIQRELKDPRVGFATVTGVEVSADLSHARVRVSVLGDDVQKDETLQALNHAKGYLRRRIADELRHMRTVPALRLQLDDSLDYTMHIEELLTDIEHERRVNPPTLPDDD